MRTRASNSGIRDDKKQQASPPPPTPLSPPPLPVPAPLTCSAGVWINSPRALLCEELLFIHTQNKEEKLNPERAEQLIVLWLGPPPAPRQLLLGAARWLLEELLAPTPSPSRVRGTRATSAQTPIYNQNWFLGIIFDAALVLWRWWWGGGGGEGGGVLAPNEPVICNSLSLWRMVVVGWEYWETMVVSGMPGWVKRNVERSEWRG